MDSKYNSDARHGILRSCDRMRTWLVEHMPAGFEQRALSVQQIIACEKLETKLEPSDAEYDDMRTRLRAWRMQKRETAVRRYKDRDVVDYRGRAMPYWFANELGRVLAYCVTGGGVVSVYVKQTRDALQLSLAYCNPEDTFRRGVRHTREPFVFGIDLRRCVAREHSFEVFLLAAIMSDSCAPRWLRNSVEEYRFMALQLREGSLSV